MRIDNPSISGSLSFIGGNNSISATSVNLTGSFSGSVVGTFEGGFSSTATSDISGAFDSVSSSLASRVASQESFSSSLDSTFATDSDVTAVSNRVGTLEGKTLVSSSVQIASDISGSFTTLSSSLASELLKNTTDTLTGDLTVTGTLTAQDLHVQEVTSSIVYSSGSNIFGASSSDIQTIYGSVGIGTNNPTGSLDVRGNIKIEGGNNKLSLYAGTNGNAEISGDPSTGDLNLNVGNTYGDLNLKLQGTTRMYISGSGNVGIGNTSPAAPLDVNGDVYIRETGALYVNTLAGYTSGVITLNNSTNFIIPSGDVGIGTTSPSTQLHIDQASNDRAGGLYIERNGSSYGLAAFVNSGGYGIIGGGGSYANDVISIDFNNAYVGIGAAPANKLHIQQAKSGTSAENYDLLRFNLTGTGAIGDSSSIVWYSTSGTKTAGIDGISGQDNILYGELAFNVRKYTTDSFDEAMRINNRGNVGIGTTLPGYKLQVNGTGYINETLYVNGDTTIDANLDLTSGGRVKVNGGNTDQYYFEGARNGVGVTYRLYDNANNIYHDSWTSQIIRVNQIGGSSGEFSVSGGDTSFNSNNVKINGGTNYNDKSNLYLSNSRTLIQSDIVNLTANGDTSLDFQTRSGGSTASSMFIDEFRRVGIGETNPQKELHINDASGNSNIRLSGGAANNETYDIGQGITAVSNGGFGFFNVAENKYAMVFQDSTCNVGIGTTSPLFKTQINVTGNGETALAFMNSAVTADGNGSTNIRFVSATNAQWANASYSAYDHSWYGNGTERMRIDSGGSVLIGAGATSGTPTSDYRSLEIGRQGNTITGAPWKSNLYLTCNATITGGSTAFTYRYASEAPVRMDLEDGIVRFYNAAAGTAGNTISWSERMRIESSGQVGIGTNAPDGDLHIYKNATQGDIRIGGGNGSGNSRIFIQSNGDNSYIDNYGDNAYKHLYIQANRLLLNTAANTGNVGIGVTNPQADLDVDQDLRVNRYHKNVFSYYTTASVTNQYFHIKTGVGTNQVCMHMYHVEGYAYGQNAIIDERFGFHTDSGGSIYGKSYKGTYANNIYASSDNKVVLVFGTMTTYYASFMVHLIESGMYTELFVKPSAATYSSSNSGAY